MFIDKFSKRYGVNWLLKRLKVCPNGYYNYKKHRKNAKEKIKASTLKRIKELYHESGGKPGYRMMTAMLARKGIHLSEQTVHRYMNGELGLRSVTRKRKYHYYKGAKPHAVFEDLLNRDFSAARRNTRWCIDFTYLYLANKTSAIIAAS